MVIHSTAATGVQWQPRVCIGSHGCASAAMGVQQQPFTNSQSSRSFTHPMTRNAKRCPVCGRTDLVRLSQHLSRVHRLNRLERQRVLGELRKESAISGESGRKYKYCPVADCGAVVKRLPLHLAKVH